MKYVFLVCTFCFGLLASAQSLNTDVVLDLPVSLSVLEYQPLNEVLTFKANLNGHTLSRDALEYMRSGSFMRNPKNITRRFTYLEIPYMDLNTELRKVMPQIPGEVIMPGPDGFTL